MYSVIKHIYCFNVICLVWFQSYSIHFFVHCFNSCDIWMPMLAVDLVFDQLFCGRRYSIKTQLMIYYPDQICLFRSKNRSFATSSCVSTTQEDFPLISYHFKLKSATTEQIFGEKIKQKQSNPPIKDFATI